MTDNGSERIDQYLLAEMTDTERENFEDQMLADDALFFSVATRENDLVDGFARNSLPSELGERFRSSLATFPARRQKIANAEVLRDYIADGKTSEGVSEEHVPWYKRLGFAFRIQALASAAFGVLLLGVIGFLVVQNRNLNSEVAQLEQLRQREAELETALESERNAAGDLTSDLDSERERRAQLEAELEELRKRIDSVKPPVNDTPPSPLIATLILRPTGTRGPAPVHRIDLAASVDKVSLLLFLPGDVKTDARADISLNSKPIAKNLKIRTRPDGTKTLQTIINTKALAPGRNTLTVHAAASQIAEYTILAERKSP